MAQPTQSDIRNGLLTRLSPAGFGVLQPNLEPVTLKVRDPLNVPNEPTSHVYFLDEGLGSVMLGPERTAGVEIGMAGREGLIGVCIVLNAGQSAQNSFIQMAATGWRIASGALLGAMDESRELRLLLLRYAHTFMTQVASTACSNADYSVEERLARWILMCHDRVDGDEIGITHEFIALMLGVRRPGVTVATHMLEGEGLIRARRGLITVLDRGKLEMKANGSYGLAESEYDRLIGDTDSANALDLVPLPSGTHVNGAGLRS
jgi:CRP-like cAMP-binding protein